MVLLSTKSEVFCGVARLPREMTAGEPSAYLAVELEIDMESQTVLDLACTAFPVLCENMMKTVLIGKEPVAGITEAKSMMAERFHGTGKAAITAALQNVLQEYQRRMAPNRDDTLSH